MTTSRKKSAGIQSRLGSFVEAWANIFVGFSINFTANMLILPRFGFHTLTAEKAFGIGCVFTVISLCRSYIIRRWFNGLRFFNAAPNRQRRP